MLNRVLVFLGETPASEAARQYAFRLAQTEGAELAGIAGIDLAAIEAPMAGGVGTTAYKAHLEAELMAQAKAAYGRLRDLYERECAVHGVPFEWQGFDSDPVAALKMAAESCDLLVTGHDTAFHGRGRDRLPDILATLCGMTPRPLVVCGDEDRGDRDVMIAYDGSLPAMRAVQLFALLRLLPGRRVHLVAIDEDKAEAQRLPAGAVRYLRGRGYEVEAAAVGTGAHPADALRIEAEGRGIGTLVMGVYGRRGLRERLFGSTTTRLLEDPPCALFVYH